MSRVQEWRDQALHHDYYTKQVGYLTVLSTCLYIFLSVEDIYNSCFDVDKMQVSAIK